MGMFPTLDRIKGFFVNFKLSEVATAELRFTERLRADLERQLAECMARAGTLDRELSESKEQLHECHDQMQHQIAARAYTERAGAFWRQDGGGRWDVYCPRCHIALGPDVFGTNGRYVCGCGWTSTFRAADVPRIVSGLIL